MNNRENQDEEVEEEGEQEKTKLTRTNIIKIQLIAIESMVYMPIYGCFKEQKQCFSLHLLKTISTAKCVLILIVSHQRFQFHAHGK